MEELYTIEFQAFGGILLDTSWKHFGGSWKAGRHHEGILDRILRHLGGLDRLFGRSEDCNVCFLCGSLKCSLAEYIVECFKSGL